MTSASRLTGQVFSDAYRTQVLGAINGLFDSAPATLGVVAVAQTAPDREIEALKLLQHARYVDGRNNADLTVVADTLAGAGFADAARRVLTPDAELLAAYRDRIDAARADMAQFGLQGVPALILEDAHGRRPVPGNILFGDLDALAQQLQAA